MFSHPLKRLGFPQGIRIVSTKEPYAIADTLKKLAKFIEQDAISMVHCNIRVSDIENDLIAIDFSYSMWE